MSAVSAYISGSPGRRTTTLPINAIHPPGRSTSWARRQPIDGSIQCHDAAATSASKRRPLSSHSSNDDVSTATFGKPASRCRATRATVAPMGATSYDVSYPPRVRNLIRTRMATSGDAGEQFLDGGADLFGDAFELGQVEPVDARCVPREDLAGVPLGYAGE